MLLIDILNALENHIVYGTLIHNHLLCCLQGIIGYICGPEGLDSSGLSSSAAVSEINLNLLSR